MSVLFFAHDIDSPSHLWMVRHLDILETSIGCVITDSVSTILSKKKLKVVRIEKKKTRLQKILWRNQLLNETLPLELDNRSILSAARKSDITVIYINFLTIAIKYNKSISRINKPVFVHCHGYDVTWNLKNQFPQRLGQAVHAPDYVESVRRLPDNVRFIANSLATKKRLTAIGIASNRIHLKYLGVPIETNPKKHHQKKQVTILYIGRLVDFKGPDLVIRAFEMACDRGLNANLIIAGDGHLTLPCQLLRRHSRYSDRITMLGAVSANQGDTLRKEADIFTAHNCVGPISGQEEAFGVTIIEAMAAGLPIISGRSGSLPELIEQGKQGLLVEPGDISAHADAFLQLAADPELRTRMGEQGVKIAKDLFSTERESQTLMEILNVP